MTVKERISLALERSDKSQRDLAKLMGLSPPTVNSMLSKDEIDSIKYLKAVEELTGFSFEWLRTGKGQERNEPIDKTEDAPLEYWKDKLESKDELIAELRNLILEMKKYQELLEKQPKGGKKKS